MGYAVVFALVVLLLILVVVVTQERVAALEHRLRALERGRDDHPYRTPSPRR